MRAGHNLSAYGLKWNPFSGGIPTAAAKLDSAVERFLWQMDELVHEGGFALITGDNGSGKSLSLRLLQENLEKTRDNITISLTRPQSTVADFYRELAVSFGTPISSSNRWGGFQALRKTWQARLEAKTERPVVLIDEAQDMQPSVLAEIRSLSSDRLDSRHLLTVVLCGDDRLYAALERSELRPIASRIRVRLIKRPLDSHEAVDALRHALEEAGNPSLFSEGVIAKLAEHSMGNWRSLGIACAQLLQYALRREASVPIDEQLLMELTEGSSGTMRRRKPDKRRS